MHCIVKEMSAVHVVMFMPSMTGKKQALLVVASSHTVDTRLLLLLLFISYGLYAPGARFSKNLRKILGKS